MLGPGGEVAAPGGKRWEGGRVEVAGILKGEMASQWVGRREFKKHSVIRM